jgi:site-specific DNA-methyltransferase (adenine-specific)
MPDPYYSDSSVTLYCGRMEDVLPELGEFDACVTDPPYGETSLAWDRWPDGWPALVAGHTRSMWCFGSMRMFLDRRDEFVGWRLSQDVVWEKHHGTGFAADRLKRVHEHALHFYCGEWATIHHSAPRVAVEHRTKGNASRGQTPHTGKIGSATWSDDGTRLVRSVIKAASMWRRGAIHPTQKPTEVLAPLIEYVVPAGGIVLDPFAGSCSTLLTARQFGRRAVGIERHEPYCEAAAKRLSIPDLFEGGVA